MDFKNFTIDEMFKAAREYPEEFKKQAELYQREAIKERCKGDEQCERRHNGMIFKLNKEANKFKDKQARLNFVIARFFELINGKD